MNTRPDRPRLTAFAPSEPPKIKRVPPTAQLAPAATRSLTRPLILWHLLSLDAPTVAALWTFFIARTTHTPIPLTSIAAMFFAVWILYAADRLLDSRTLSPDLEPRHLFHHRHRRAFRLAIAFTAACLTPLLLTIPLQAIRLDLLAAALLFAWFILIHATPAARDPRRLPKELAVGIFFSAAVFIPTVARTPALRPALIVPAVLFAALCSLNCLYIYAWEHPFPNPSAHTTTRMALRHLAPTTLLLILAAVLACLLPQPLIPLATALAAVSLFALNRTRTLHPTLLRAAADLALLTPVLLLPFTR
jgi:hypothetical protein